MSVHINLAFIPSVCLLSLFAVARAFVLTALRLISVSLRILQSVCRSAESTNVYRLCRGVDTHERVGAKKFRLKYWHIYSWWPCTQSDIFTLPEIVIGKLATSQSSSPSELLFSAFVWLLFEFRIRLAFKRQMLCCEKIQFGLMARRSIWQIGNSALENVRNRTIHPQKNASRFHYRENGAPPDGIFIRFFLFFEKSKLIIWQRSKLAVSE